VAIADSQNVQIWPTTMNSIYNTLPQNVSLKPWTSHFLQQVDSKFSNLDAKNYSPNYNLQMIGYQRYYQ